ncbi:MAG TPA: methyltransferase [Candidatus Polarisedimenticolia bacterium]|nr:methyltransferase [Candidatus Polarisedimenticolia bacterium]
MPRRSKVFGWTRRLGVYAFVAWLVAASDPTPALVLGGSVIAFLGEGLRIWAAGHLVKSARLVTTGPYAYVQHPLYLGRLLIFTGLTIAARVETRLNTAILVAGYILFFIYYLPRTLDAGLAR